MTRDDLVTKLLSLPELIETQEQVLLANTSALQEARAERDLREATLLLGGSIDARNAEGRAAQLLVALHDEDAEIRCHERQVAHERIVLGRLVNDFRSVRALISLLAAEAQER
jgi:hypothetical protein